MTKNVKMSKNVKNDKNIKMQNCQNGVGGAGQDRGEKWGRGGGR